MTSVVAEQATALVGGRVPSTLLAHDGSCCPLAEAWLHSADAAHCTNPFEPPRWITKRFTWGPMRWPAYLCEAATEETLDCGGLAALSLLAWRRRCDAVFPVLIVQRYNAEDCGHWTASWDRAAVPCSWIASPFVYHEGIGIVSDGSLQIWDPTDDVFIEPQTSGEYGAWAGLAAFTPSEVRFGTLALPPGQWVWRDAKQEPDARYG